MRASFWDGSIMGCGLPWVNSSSPMSTIVFSWLTRMSDNALLPFTGVLE